MSDKKYNNDLEEIFFNNKGRLINKWSNYFEIYDRHLNKYRGKEITILEIGVFQGGSLDMWQKYFGPKAKIYGIDIDPRCKQFEKENIEILIGSQSDVNFLNEVKQKIPKVDILIDDGGHTMEQMRVSFDNLIDHIKPDGVYICEDLHCCYWLSYGGGYKRKNSFIEYSKNFIDYINAWNSKQYIFKPNNFTKTIQSIHYYDGVIVMEKRIMEQPKNLMTGIASFDYTVETKQTLIRNTKYVFNKIMQTLRLPWHLYY